MERGFPLVLFCLFIFIASCMSSPNGKNNSHVAFFIFGDSVFDNGNNNYINTTNVYLLANFVPYGITYFNHATGRFCDGRLIPDFIAEYAGLPLIPAYLDPTIKINDFVYGANFASGGAGVLNETNSPYVINLKPQIDWFANLVTHYRKNLGHAKTDHLLANAVYIFSCGCNDYSNVLTHEFGQDIDNVIGNYTEALKELYKQGGRKFAILNLPENLGCWPIGRAQIDGYGCNDDLNKLLAAHNDRIPPKLDELQKELDGFVYAILDYSTIINDRMNHPLQYGFKSGDTACCGSGPFRGIYDCGRFPGYEVCDNPDEYVFFDSTHPNEVAYRQIAELFWDGGKNITTSYNLKTLFQRSV